MKPLFFLLLLLFAVFLPAYFPHAWSEPDCYVEPAAPFVFQAGSDFERVMIAILGFLIPIAGSGVAPFLIFVFLYRRLLAKKKQLSDDP